MDCEYTGPDDMLIDSITDGVHTKKLQEQLLDRGEELTVAKAIEIRNVAEASDEEPPITGSEKNEESEET